MSNRVVYGNSFSENGWPMVDQGSCTWVTVPGTNPPVSLQIQNGWPLALLRAFVADWNAYIEPVRDADSACWTATNDVGSSNHLSGTACDVDWADHRFHVSYDGFNDAQIATMREMLDFYEGTIWWGEDWGLQNIGPFDCMHVNLHPGTYNNPHTGDVIARKIRADGFSTFRRGNAPAHPPGAQVLADATGLSVDRAGVILPTVISGLQASECNNVNRIAMWLAQCGEESAGFSTTEEFASGAEYEGRGDLGNTQPGDGVRFKGRTWIQITGRSHYAEFSRWANGKGLCSSPTQFVDSPASLGDLPWAGIGAAWYWTVSRPDINALSDGGDVLTVTKRINGGTNGLADRQNRYNRAHALGDQLLTLTQQSTGVEDDMASVPQDQWDRVYRELTQRLPSRSPIRYLDQTKHYPDGLVDTMAGFELNIDGMTHVQYVLELAKLGHQPTIDLLNEVAGADPAQYPDRQADAQLARNILATAKREWGAASAKMAAQPVTDNAADYYAALTSANAEVARLRAENAQLRAQLNTAPEVSTAVAVPESKTELKTLGDHAGQLVDSVEGWTNAALSMDVKQQAALKASINVLTMKNGSQP